MTPSEAQSKIAALRGEVAFHDERYYKKARPEIGDREYDRLKRELAALEEQVSRRRREGRGESIRRHRPRGRRPRRGISRPYRHRQPMQSLDNTYSEAELREFHARDSRVF
jgi:DNA ligase (NAD+)